MTEAAGEHPIFQELAPEPGDLLARLSAVYSQLDAHAHEASPGIEHEEGETFNVRHTTRVPHGTGESVVTTITTVESQPDGEIKVHLPQDSQLGEPFIFTIKNTTEPENSEERLAEMQVVVATLGDLVDKVQSGKARIHIQVPTKH